jgi:hypothetical protein
MPVPAGLGPLELLGAIERPPAMETIVVQRTATSRLGRAVEGGLAERVAIYSVQRISLHSVRHQGRVVGCAPTLSIKLGGLNERAVRGSTSPQSFD